MANTYSPQFKERALRMMDDHRRVEETSVWGCHCDWREARDLPAHVAGMVETSPP